jgi:DNA topoisomerase-1
MPKAKTKEKTKAARKKSLVVVESPAKAKTINKFLGSGYVVKASMGHVRDLPAKKFGIDVDEDFAAEYQIIPGREKSLNELKKAAKTAERVFMATDRDREGEAIAWHLVEALGVAPEIIHRVSFNQITRKAIEKAFEESGRIDMAKVDAQQARRFLDRIVGYKLSPLLWKKVTKGLSAGRVQSVAVRLIVEREREIRAFEPEEYWKLLAELENTDGARFKAELKKLDGKTAKVGNEEQATALVEELNAAHWSVLQIKKKKKTQWPHPPFITSTLQQQASIRLRYSATRTMRIAQQLYEGIELGGEGSVGLITYMRTDSLNLAPESIDEARNTIRAQFGDDYVPEKPNRYRSRKGAQEAHEAIRPTRAMRRPDDIAQFLSPDQLKLYTLIWERFVACQMRPAIVNVTDLQVAAATNGDDPPRALFSTRGQEIVFDGFMRLAGRKSDDVILPELTDGEALSLVGLAGSQHFTQPPPRYTEATLVKTLEREGIGRPSTYAPIIKTIQDRGYVRQEKRKFSATELGEIVTDLLLPHFPEIMEVGFTSSLEKELDRVENEEEDWKVVLRRFYERFDSDLQTATKEMKKVKAEESDVKCELCGKPMLYRFSKSGKFLGCSGFPECRSTMALDTNGEVVVKEIVETEHECEKCGSTMVIREGRRGKFLACSAFPKCRNAKDIDADGNPVEPEVSDEKCEKCGSDMVVKRGRRGPFLACTGYPKCKNAKPLRKRDEPEPAGLDCPDCGKPMLKRRSRRGQFLGCSDYPKCKKTLPMKALEEGEAS